MSAADTDHPEPAANTDQPEPAADTDQSEPAANTDQPEPAANTDQPEPAADKMDESLVDSMSQLQFNPSQSDDRQEVPTCESYKQESAEQSRELSSLSGYTDPSRFSVETELQDHKSRRVRVEMGIFKAKMKAGITPKEEAKYLSTLAEHYERMYDENTNNWAARLRAHSLYVSCSLRDSSMQSKYAKAALRVMKSSLSEDSLINLTNCNKRELEETRQHHKAQLADIKSNFLPTIDDENLDNNRSFIIKFSQKVQMFSSQVTKDVRNFLSKLVDQSVTSVGSLPPCGIAFVAIGSLARSETTPYSDVEYFFLVEQDNPLNREYFRNLAYHTYFLIGNLGETNLKTMNIPELTEIGFKDTLPKGMRIDGLESKAGNIPTGNGVDPCSELILTVEQLIKRYRLLLDGTFESTDKGVASDLVDMLAHRTLVWYYGNGKHLVDGLNEQLWAIPHPDKRRFRSSSILQEDLHKYNFLPFASASHIHQNVKSDIYRYPSLLVTGWNNAFDLKTENNWKALHKLLLDGKLNQEEFHQIAFLLASAIFIRIDTYLFYNSQTDKITLWKTTGDVGSPYSCSRELFLLMMCYLIPLKSIQAAARHIPILPEVVFDSFTAICITHFYCSAHKEVVKLFIDKFSEQRIFQETELFLQRIDGLELHILLASVVHCDYRDKRWLQLLNTVCRKYPDFNYCIRSVLHLHIDPEEALREVECFSQKSLISSTEKIEAFRIEIQCLITLRRFVDAEKRLRDRLSYFNSIAESNRICKEQMLICNAEHNELMGQLHDAKTNYKEAKEFYQKALGLRREAYGTAVIHGSISECILGIGMMCFRLQKYQESLTFLESCISMECALDGAESNSFRKAKALQFIGSCYSRMNQKKAETMLKKSYDIFLTLNGEGSKPDVLTCMTHIASHHYTTGNYSKSLECWMGVLEDRLEAKHVDTTALADATFSIGLCHFCLQDFRKAWQNFDDSLGYYREIGDFSREANRIIIELKICEERFQAAAAKQENRRRRPSGRS